MTEDEFMNVFTDFVHRRVAHLPDDSLKIMLLLEDFLDKEINVSLTITRTPWTED